MSVHKEAKGTWRVIYRYVDWTGASKQTSKRGFRTKKEALAWEREQQSKDSADLDMNFASFVELYEKDMKSRLKENTWMTKEHIIRDKLLPFFGGRKMCEIAPKDIMAWQNEMLNVINEKGEKYSPTYLKTVHNQCSCLFNHAVKFYGLKENPAQKVGNMGKAKSKEMLFWTKEEYTDFAKAIMDKPLSFYAFEVLYWTGIREGELLALTPEDFDFQRKTLRINKSYQRLKGRDVITTPKTEKSNRVIVLPDFLCEELEEFIASIYKIQPSDRLFTITKNYLHNEMTRGCKESGVKRIRIHDLRHSHISSLIDMGFSAIAIADRVGHESIRITLHYAHLFPSRQTEMADRLNGERTGVI
ncbi:MAG: site-specific integrase [Eubacteriales bacterium]